jgi:uncharacterized protein (TIGR02646 family)
VRFIDLDLLLGRPETQPLIDAAEAARLAILAAPNAAARKALIAANQDKWVAFRSQLQALFGTKCWYTETKNHGTDDDIDHYRPKGRIADRRGHGGYWWEALSWRNFRLSCHRANRLRRNPETGKTYGKGDRFPLIVEADRWMSPAENCNEQPTLLDPTEPADPPIITFDTDGRVALSPFYAGDADAAMRVNDSRIYLHLDWPTFVTDRRDLYANILLKVTEGDKADVALNRGDLHARAWLKSVSRDLIRLTKDQASYSRAAAAYVLRFRDRDWIKKNVLPHIPAVTD